MSDVQNAKSLSEGWAAHILIDKAHQEAWLSAFAQPFESWIERQDDDLYLRSVFFKDCSTPQEVRPIAVDVLRVLVGAMALTHPPHETRFLSVVQIDTDGRRHINVFLEGLSMMMLVSSLNDEGEPAARTAVKRALSSEHLEEALGYFGDQGGWFDLYKCIECTELWAGSKHKLAALNLVSAKNLKRAKKTANDARHARLKNSPLPDAPSFDEAYAIVKALLGAALEKQAMIKGG